MSGTHQLVATSRFQKFSYRTRLGVGGFLGIAEKDVAVPFDAVKRTTKDGKIYLTLDTTKDALKGAPGFRYDR